MSANGNAPDFDPIDASPEEEREMVAGYLAAWSNEVKPPITSIAFDHGWRMARNDKSGTVDDDQRVNAQRFLAKQRAALINHGQGEGSDDA